MSNCCRLYAISDYDESPLNPPEVIFNIGSQPFAIPFLFRLLVSGHTRCVPSLFAVDEDEYDNRENEPEFSALLGDGDIGFARF